MLWYYMHNILKKCHIHSTSMLSFFSPLLNTNITDKVLNWTHQWKLKKYTFFLYFISVILFVFRCVPGERCCGDRIYKKWHHWDSEARWILISNPEQRIGISNPALSRICPTKFQKTSQKATNLKKNCGQILGNCLEIGFITWQN